MPDNPNSIEKYGDNNSNYEKPSTGSDPVTPIQQIISMNANNNTVTYVGTDGQVHTESGDRLEQ